MSLCAVYLELQSYELWHLFRLHQPIVPLMLASQTLPAPRCSLASHLIRPGGNRCVLWLLQSFSFFKHFHENETGKRKEHSGAKLACLLLTLKRALTVPCEQTVPQSVSFHSDAEGKHADPWKTGGQARWWSRQQGKCHLWNRSSLRV